MEIRQRYRFIRSLAQLCEWQTLLLQAKDIQIEQSKVRELQYQRHYLDLAIAFRRALDEEDPNLAEKLENIICDVSDLVARLEEHIVA